MKTKTTEICIIAKIKFGKYLQFTGVYISVVSDTEYVEYLFQS
jgi:hypothetical protein